MVAGPRGSQNKPDIYLDRSIWFLPEAVHVVSFSEAWIYFSSIVPAI